MREAVIVATARTPLTKAHRGVKYAVVTMCMAGGMGAAGLFEIY
jgi:acetyl-CoA acetyltransferase